LPQSGHLNAARPAASWASRARLPPVPPPGTTPADLTIPVSGPGVRSRAARLAPPLATIQLALPEPLPLGHLARDGHDRVALGGRVQSTRLVARQATPEQVRQLGGRGRDRRLTRRQQALSRSFVRWPSPSLLKSSCSSKMRPVCVSTVVPSPGGRSRTAALRSGRRLPPQRLHHRQEQRVLAALLGRQVVVGHEARVGPRLGVLHLAVRPAICALLGSPSLV